MLLPVEVALSFALLTEDDVLVLACSQIGGEVCFTEVEDTGRGTRWRQSMMSLVLDVMSLKGQSTSK